MRILVCSHRDALRRGTEHADEGSSAQLLTRFLLDDFGCHPKEVEVAFLCDFLFELVRPDSSLWMCRRTDLAAMEYLEAAEDLIGGSGGGIDGERYDVATAAGPHGVAEGQLAGFVHRIGAGDTDDVCELMHRFWPCGAGRWLFFGGGTSRQMAMEYAEAADSTKKIQRMLFQIASSCGVVAATYDDSIVEGASVAGAEVVTHSANSAASKRGVVLWS